MVERARVFWIVPIGINESRSVVADSLESIQINSTSKDEIVIVTDLPWIEQIVKGNESCVILPHPIIKSPGAARNTALNYVYKTANDSDIIVFADSDDIVLSSRRSLTIRELENSDLVTFSYHVNSRRSKIRKANPGVLKFFFRTNIWLPTVGVKVGALNNSFFDESLLLGEDTVFFAKIIKNDIKVSWNRTPVIVYKIDPEKAKSKFGFTGLVKEFRFRKRLLKVSQIRYYPIILAGGTVSSVVKIFKPFYRFYKNAHS